MNDYFIGLDIGTGSVGWAVTDTQYNLKKFNGLAMWGSRIFPSAQTAEARRGYRTSRHRRDRLQERIQWLDSVFKEPIESIDPTFFSRLKESRFLEVDKNLPASSKSKFLLFIDKGFNDKHFHKKYPTIYHLRQALMNETSIM